MKSYLAAVRLELIKSRKIIRIVSVFSCCDHMREFEMWVYKDTLSRVANTSCILSRTRLNTVSFSDAWNHYMKHFVDRHFAGKSFFYGSTAQIEPRPRHC